MHSAEGAMFPITKASLSFGEISDYWSRKIEPTASSLLSILVSAWWLGELRGNSRHPRLQLLKTMFTSQYKDDLGIVFIVSDGGGSSVPKLPLPDGSLEVDLRYEIPLPSSNTDNWDEAACKEAFQRLAQITERSLFDTYREFAVFLPSTELTYEEFNTWSRKRGYPEREFWRLPLKKSKRGRPAQYNWVGVKKRLRTYVSEHGPVQTRDELLQKCADFASELHPKNSTPSDKTIREAIVTHELAAAAGLDPGK
jgi:hypothetical protein